MLAAEKLPISGSVQAHARNYAFWPTAPAGVAAQHSWKPLCMLAVACCRLPLQSC
jgi:hypothetical protein